MSAHRTGVPRTSGVRQRRRDLTLVRMTPDIVHDQWIGACCTRRLVFSRENAFAADIQPRPPLTPNPLMDGATCDAA